MKYLIIYGAGGLARETAELVNDINSVSPCWNIKGFIDDFRGKCSDQHCSPDIIGTWEVLKDAPKGTYVVIAIGDPAAKEKIYNRICALDNIRFPVLIHPSARISGDAIIGEGSIIGIDCIVSTGVHIGRHVFLNMRTVVGHDAEIDDFCSCLVNCVVAGSVHIMEGTLVGSGSIIMEKKTVGRKCRLSMGSIVNFDVEDHHTVLTPPSKSIYFG
jgi:sugar O-acyltransferase (sialic acid O-acetyltransferase NeuD family)